MSDLPVVADPRPLGAETLQRMEKLVAAAIRRARRAGSPILVSACARTPEVTDPAAPVAASRTAAEPWFCFEQPDRDGAARGRTGLCAGARGRGRPERFAEVAARWRALVAGAVVDDPGGRRARAWWPSVDSRSPPRRRLAALGGLFAGVVDRARALAGPRAGETWLTVNTEVAPDDTAGRRAGALPRRLAELRRRRCR